MFSARPPFTYVKILIILFFLIHFHLSAFPAVFKIHVPVIQKNALIYELLSGEKKYKVEYKRTQGGITSPRKDRDTLMGEEAIHSPKNKLRYSPATLRNSSDHEEFFVPSIIGSPRSDKEQNQIAGTCILSCKVSDSNEIEKYFSILSTMIHPKQAYSTHFKEKDTDKEDQSKKKKFHIYSGPTSTSKSKKTDFYISKNSKFNPPLDLKSVILSSFLGINHEEDWAKNIKDMHQSKENNPFDFAAGFSVEKDEEIAQAIYELAITRVLFAPNAHTLIGISIPEETGKLLLWSLDLGKEKSFSDLIEEAAEKIEWLSGKTNLKI